MYADVVTLLRCLYVGTTRGITPKQQTLLGTGRDSPEPYAQRANVSGYTLSTDDDKPRVRFWYRRVFGVLILSSWIPVILGFVMGYNYVNAETNAQKAETVQTLRYFYIRIVTLATRLSRSSDQIRDLGCCFCSHPRCADPLCVCAVYSPQGEPPCCVVRSRRHHRSGEH